MRILARVEKGSQVQNLTITKKQLSTEDNEVISTVNCSVVDNLIVELNELITPAFKAWYCKQFYRLGRERVLRLAAIAKADGFDQRKYFSKLLKEAV